MLYFYDIACNIACNISKHNIHCLHVLCEFLTILSKIFVKCIHYLHFYTLFTSLYSDDSLYK